MLLLRRHGARPVQAVLLAVLAGATVAAAPLTGTIELQAGVDRSEEMRAGIERYLDQALEHAVTARGAHWRRDLSSAAAYVTSVAPNRARFRKLVGAVETRVAAPELQLLSTIEHPGPWTGTAAFTAHVVRWRVYDDFEAEGWLLRPRGEVRARVVAVPDADQTPEEIAGLAPGLPPEGQYARRLAESGCQVLIPTLVSRAETFSGSAAVDRFTNQPHREWIYRQAYTFGRHVIGYEVHEVLAAVDWFAKQNAGAASGAPIGVLGWGEGGLLAFTSAALDERILATLVSGYFGPREQLWSEPIYRNCFGLLREFGDAEIASLVAPRTLIIEAAGAPEVAGPPAVRPGRRASGAVGAITTPPFTHVQREVERAQALCGRFGSGIRLRREPAARAPALGEEALADFLRALDPAGAGLAPVSNLRSEAIPVAAIEARQKRLVAQLENHTQALIARSRTERDASFWKTSPITTPAAWDRAMQPRRDGFWNDVIGRLPPTDVALNPRSRLLYDRPDSVGYEIVLDVLPGVTLWGYLLQPKGLADGERRPLVVAQHGLGGVPADLINEDPGSRAHQVYQAFAAQFVARGYVVFVPHFPWRAQDDYRRLQRKANPLGLSVFSFLLAQHGRLLDWLEGLPFVDARRMGLYGLSWGGKVALRVPALEPRYALSIASGDFNEWIWKNATTAWAGSYMFAPEPDMFDFNLASVAGHAEMAAMIAPRAFMVERGHDDGVGTDEQVAFEYARVRRLYDRLGVPEKTAIEFFVGGHQIHAIGTFHFLQRHFNWPPAAALERAVNP